MMTNQCECKPINPINSRTELLTLPYGVTTSRTSFHGFNTPRHSTVYPCYGSPEYERVLAVKNNNTKLHLYSTFVNKVTNCYTEKNSTLTITSTRLHHSLSTGHVCHRCVFIYVHVNNPSLTVSHVVSLTVPTKTAPVGSNPFEDDEEEEEEEMAVEQQTTVNHISVNKEEIKTLVNRRKTLRPPTTSSLFPVFYLFFLWVAVIRAASLANSSSSLLCSLLLCNPLFSLRWQVVVLHAWSLEMASHTKPMCVCPSLLTVPCLAEH